jgi:hypothetical protein
MKPYTPSLERMIYTNDLTKWSDADILDEIEVATYFWTSCLLEDHLPVSGEQLLEAQGIWASRLEAAEKEAARRDLSTKSDPTIPLEE